MKLRFNALITAMCIFGISSIATATTKLLVYGLTDDGTIYYRDGVTWTKIQTPNEKGACHIAAGPGGQLYAISKEHTNARLSVLLDRGTPFFRAHISASNTSGDKWIAMPSKRPIIGIAAGKSTVLACDAPNHRDIFRCNRPQGERISPWNKIKGTAYGVAVDPVNDTLFILDDWREGRGLFSYLAVVGKVLFYKNGWCDCSKIHEARYDFHLGEEGWGIYLDVYASLSNFVQIAVGNNSLFGVGFDGLIFFRKVEGSVQDTTWVGLEDKNRQNTILSCFEGGKDAWEIYNQTRPFIAATAFDDINEFWGVQNMSCRKVETKESREGCFIWRIKDINVANKQDVAWELVYDSSDPKLSPDQKLSFKEIALGSVELTQEEEAAIQTAAEDAKRAEAAKQRELEKQKKAEEQKEALEAKEAKRRAEKAAAREAANEKARFDAARAAELRGAKGVPEKARRPKTIK
jgi:hypothetical protein